MYDKNRFASVLFHFVYLCDTYFAGNGDLYYGMEMLTTLLASAGTATFRSFNMESEINASKMTGYGKNSSFEGGSKTKDIYRAVSSEEYDDIFSIKGFRARQDGKSFQAKEFGNNFEETLEFANQSINSDKVAIIKVTIPGEIYNQLNHMNLDSAIFKSGTPVVEPEMLDKFNKSIINIEHVF